MKIHVASDHAGFALKNILIDFLNTQGYAVVDHGPVQYDESDDYPDFISLVAAEVANDPKENKGIILGGSGQGEAIVANRYADVRAAVYYGGSLDIIKLSREHNDANVLSLGARFVSNDEAQEAVQLWLGTSFSEEERHVRRIKKIETKS